MSVTMEQITVEDYCLRDNGDEREASQRSDITRHNPEKQKEERDAYTIALSEEVRRTGKALLELSVGIRQKGYTNGADYRMAQLSSRLRALASAGLQLQEGNLAQAMRFWRPSREGGHRARTR